ncbi:hypothetical protein KJ953_00355 [Patescibacteria group bacterium]|nr:hypothetical protein [Patescibacteria group bacterium]MBU1256132.1 hypothetical protein [Patescibacteria group bacterium]MBU1457889.1 hypothetical protein [Patescibacteria group bacterium]
MVPYQSRHSKLPGTSYKEVYKHAWKIFTQIRSQTKRQPYIKSAYFNKQKVFFTHFWIHLFQKPQRLRKNRLKFFQVAIDLITNSHNQPISKPNPNKKSETLHRFYGLTKNKELFIVQIKQTANNRKLFMSCFQPE